MKYNLRVKAVQVLLMLIFLVGINAGWAQTPSFKDGIRKGQIKVKFTSTVAPAALSNSTGRTSGGIATGMKDFDLAAQKAQAKSMYRLFPYDARFEAKLRKHGLHLWYVVEIDEKMDPKLAVAQFGSVSGISVVEVDHEEIVAPYKVTPYVPGPTAFATLPFNDPMLGDQWHYNNTSKYGYGDADINLFEAWKTTTGGNDIIVSVHDQGVDVKHQDLKSNIWVNLVEQNGVAGVDDDQNGYIDDINGWNYTKKTGDIDPEFHGTHVAGTVAAINNNGIGVSGIAGGNGSGNGVKIMSLEILGGSGIERSYIYAANNGAVISQNSWGWSEPYFYDQSVLDAIDYFVAEAGDYPGSPMKGGLVVFAAGNSNSNEKWYPAYHSSILSVSSLGPEWKKAGYSNYGDWVEVAAPGGDMQEYGSKYGVLSTIPKDQYAYVEGTSMACPHISGVASLALANRDKQLTNTQLWNKIVTGVVSIDTINPDYIGKLGSGAVDASLAILNDKKLAPATITDLRVPQISQEFAQLAWTVPTDEDDGKPITFEIYYGTDPLNSSNLASATKIHLSNALAAGSEYSYELSGLIGLTTYYFTVTSTDRWGNESTISNVIEKTTNEGPAISVDENSTSISLGIDISVSDTVSHDIIINNGAEGILRWDHFMRHNSSLPSYNAALLHYPKVSEVKSGGVVNLGRANAEHRSYRLSSEPPQAVAQSFTPQEMTLADFPTNLVGETNLNLSNSAAGRFAVIQPEGFNLTEVRMYLQHDPANGPVIIEIYKGSTPEKKNLIYAQEYSNYDTNQAWANVQLNEQIFFESGATFWVVFHVPANNLFPLGLGYESAPANSANCFMSFDLGAKWAPLEELLGSEDFAWAMVAASYNEYLGTYLTLDPGAGDIAGLSSDTTTLTAWGATLVNGAYSANMILTSNDAANRELRIPISLTVTGQKPNIQHIDIADFGNAFIGTTKVMEIVLENTGYGNFNDVAVTISGSQFEIDGWAPWQIAAREKEVLKLNFKPTAAGNINEILTVTNGVLTYEIPLFGVGVETSRIVVTPESQVIDSVAIGQELSAQIMVENAGAYPLKYFVPGFDDKGVSENWPSPYHSYGYKLRSNDASESSPIDYNFTDISGGGVNITDLVKNDTYYTLDMGFDFPYYGDKVSTVYIAQKGFTTFDNSVRPINTPRIPGNEWSPKGYVSLLGTYLNYVVQGEIFYKVEADRVIIQFDNVWDGFAEGESMTAQMVLFANGDIRFFYDKLDISEANKLNLAILIEDLEQSDGILIHDYSHPRELYSGLALGLDYPGPGIIAKVENGSGILSPGSSVNVNVTLNTASLDEGIVNRYVNVISNDPENQESYSRIQINVTDGGLSQPVVSVDSIAFGDVFQGAIRTATFTIKNPGTADADIRSMILENGLFGLTGNDRATIKPGLYEVYTVTIPTATIGPREDLLTITYTDGLEDVISLTGNVIEAPAIDVDLSPIQHTLAYGDSVAIPLLIENTGKADLEVAITGDQYMTFVVPAAPNAVEILDNTYVYKKHNNGDFYQWIDIRGTGTQLPFLTNYEKEDYWRDLTLPFPIEFYGKKYSKMKVGDNGIISFDEDPPIMMFNEHLPTKEYKGTFIMPYWAFGGFNQLDYPEEEIGIFYQFYSDKIIITWSYLVNNFGGMGDPVSAQIIIYRNGTMKFQYKIEGSLDITSNFTVIGVQEDTTNAVPISENLNLDHGSGLAFILIPAKKHTIHQGSTLAGEIKLDATNIYGGVYTAPLVITSNAPNREYLEKPVELTVAGEAIFDAPDTVAFGNKMIAFEWGSPKVYTIDMNLENNGSAPMEINWGQMADTTNLSLMMQVDGWFGPEWTLIENIWNPWNWESPTFKIMPGDKLAVRAAFYPSTPGDFSNEVILTTSIGEKRFVLTGTGIEPPAIEVDVTPIEVAMNTLTNTEERTIAFNNTNGLSDLSYELSIDYGRAIPTGTATEAMATTTAAGKTRKLETPVAIVQSPIPFGNYNRTISYTTRTTPDNFVGTGGTAPFQLATKYNAGPEGFNLSHIETWFRAETLASGTISVEIRVGGTNITNSLLLAEGSLNFNASGSDESGKWWAVAMNESARIYPNEDFYVLVTYPFGIEFPQGIINDSETVPYRYLYFNEGFWYDIQNESGFDKTGWLMYAAEQTPIGGSWISITSAANGALPMGEASSVNLLFDGQYAERGDQIASLVFKSNDPVNPEISVPTSLHMNQGPQFLNVPENVTMDETDTVTLTINVVDMEDDDFVIAATRIYPDVTYTYDKGVLTITLLPDYGDQGVYHYVFEATDDYDATTEMTLTVDVSHLNQAPKYIYADEVLQYPANGSTYVYDLEEFFTDPDGDAITFTAEIDHADVADVFISAGQFLIQPHVIGSTTLSFNVIDTYGAVTVKNIPLSVNKILGLEEDLTHGITLFPNPVNSLASLHLSDEWTGTITIEIIDMSGKLWSTQKSERITRGEIQLDVAGLKKGMYILRANSTGKQAVVKLIKE